ncbi:MAG: asparagine synthase-related protein [Muribaculaceae bacterium]|jgi:asparagine synthase (glutamine-hydrolysing)|nr:asparagine synthase-related protein [Muribaculaceae bacterium]
MITGHFSDIKHFTLSGSSDKPDADFQKDGVKVMFFGKIHNKSSLGFSDDTDCASIVHAIFVKYGIEGLKKIDSSSVSIIIDGDTMLIARDHHGTYAQIYYSSYNFASHPDGLDRTSANLYEPDYKSLATFLSIGYIPTPHCAIKGVSKLPAGCALKVSGEKMDVVKIFPTDYSVPHDERSIEELSEEYGNLHVDSIKRRIGNSENVGLLLSGGYDSGSNLAALREIYSGKVSSFSIGFKGDNWSELPLADCMSKYFSTDHHTYEIDGSEVLNLPEIVHSLGDPFVEGGLMVNYCAMKMIGNDKPDVILGGDGSDQYFGTAGRETALNYLACKSLLMPEMKMALKALSHNQYEKNNRFYRARFHLNSIVNILDGDKFGFPDFMIPQILQDSSLRPFVTTEKEDLSSWEALYSQHAMRSDLEKVINQVILFKASRMADLFSVNIAFPFMDNRLFEFLQALPVKWKCHGDSVKAIAKGNCTSKYLLKYHYKPMLPKEITSKKKQGGFAPMPLFFEDDDRRARLNEFIMGCDASQTLFNRKNVEIFLKNYCDKCHETGNWFWYRQNKAIQYFNLLSLSVWWEIFMKGNKDLTL